MIKNPYINAVLAAAYIAVIVFFINSFSEPNTPDRQTVIVPMMMISLLVLSVSLMGVLFFYEPLRLFLDNKRKEALVFFFKTVGTFAVFDAILFAIFLSSR